MSYTAYNTDVLVIGGGPAGTALALSLLNYSKCTVTIVEQSDFSRERIGEHVSPSLFNILDYLKMDKSDFEEGCFLPAYGTIAYWGNEYPSRIHSIFTAENSTFQLDRQKFDFKLIEQVVERGGSVFPRTKCLDFIKKENTEWCANLKHAERGSFKVKAKYLVDATGRNAMVCRRLGITIHKMDSLVGVGVFLKPNEETPLSQEQILETTELGWWYKAVLPNGTITACFFTDADIVSKYGIDKKENWTALVAQSKFLKNELKGATALSLKPWVRNAATQLTDTSGHDNFIAIGDAASSFDPISSMGIGFAMTSAIHAAKLIKHQLLNDIKNRDSLEFQQDIVKNFKNYLKLRSEFYAKEIRWKPSLFWERRQAENNDVMHHYGAANSRNGFSLVD
ncbi:MAG: NAD(P)/FAD-dependent oxidoreductase [Aureisphaera sp.]